MVRPIREAPHSFLGQPQTRKYAAVTVPLLESAHSVLELLDLWCTVQCLLMHCTGSDMFTVVKGRGQLAALLSLA